MLDILTWLLATELLGLLAFPVVYVIVPWLPDRGYTLAKPAGLLLTFYPLWLLASSQVVPNSLFTLLGVVVVLALVSCSIAWYQRAGMQEFLRREWQMLLLGEAVFLGVLAIWVFIRAYDPAINHTEQPMDFAFLNSLVVSQYFPPRDPWLAGESVSYYYFGYLMFGGLMRLAAVPTAVGYNLALALVAALAAVGAFGIMTNVVRLAGGTRRGAVISGLVAVVLLLGVANLASGLELARASGSGSAEFWEWVDIKGLDGPLKSFTWYPSEPGWWWWRATRVIDTVHEGSSLDYTITEFPFFSFLLGDLHPHVMSLPFLLAFIGLVLNFFVAPHNLGLAWLRGSAGETVGLGLALGALGFINLWDLPVSVVLLLGAALVKGYGQERAIGSASLVAFPFVIVVVVMALVFYLPFYLTFDSQAQGVWPVEYVTGAFHFLIIWGLFLLIAVPFIVWELAYILRGRQQKWQDGVLAVAIAMTPWVLWALVEGVLTWDIPETIGRVFPRFVHLLPLMGFMAVTVYLVLQRVTPRRSLDTSERLLVADEGLACFSNEGPDTDMVSSSAKAEQGRMAHAFPLMLMALAVLLLVWPELFYLVDLFNNRMNTIFKLYYQAWIFLSLACAYAIYYLGFRYSRSGPWLRVIGYGWIGLLFVGIGVSIYYPAAATYSKTGGFAGERTLDGLAYLAQSSVGEFNGIQWLKGNYRSGDVIIEAVGDDYSAYGRVSASTGIPTVLGWPFHEQQWRGSREPFHGREWSVQRLYETRNLEEAQKILERFEVTYIFVGPRELAKYGAQGLDFTYLGDVVFQQENVVIYRVRT